MSSLRRALTIMRILGQSEGDGLRLKDVAAAASCGASTAHRALQDLIAEGFVEQVSDGNRYRLALDFFVLAASARQRDGLLDLARPCLLRLSATLNDSIFLLVRHNYDAVCLDRVEGPFPIRTFTGDIGGRIPLGIGQASLTILAHLPDAEREAVIAFNIPRIRDRGGLDEADLRSSIAAGRELGWVSQDTGILPGMAGVGVPIFDASGRVVAAFGLGTLRERLQAKRLPNVVNIMQSEANALSERLNPFDPALRRPAQSLSRSAN